MFAVALTMAALVLAAQQDVCRAQVSIHTDANTNSFSLKTPGLQQTFTRYYGAARTQPQQQEVEQPQQQLEQEQELEQVPFGNFPQYPSAYQQPSSPGRLRGASKQQQQQPALRAQQPGFGAAGLVAGAGAGAGTVVPGAINLPSYADQMHAAFLDYQRQRAEFEQQQQQLLQKLYHHYPEVSVPQAPSPVQPQAQQQQQQPQPPPPTKGFQGVASVGANRFVYHRPQFGSNGLQPGAERLSGGGAAGPAVGSGQPLRTAGAGDFYSTQQHLGFMQQQHQDVLRDQQQSVAQQFATQLAPTTRQTFGMAVPMSSVLGAPSYQPSSDVSHVNFSSGNLNYSF